MSAAALPTHLDQARQLLARLERVSADSVWAHRSSGYRGSLLKWIDRAENQLAAGILAPEPPGFEWLYTVGLELLARAAREKLAKQIVHH